MVTVEHIMALVMISGLFVCFCCILLALAYLIKRFADSLRK